MIARIAKEILAVRRNLTGDRPVPLSVAVNITGRCNLRCEFCEKGGQAQAGEIDFPGVKRLIDFSVACHCPIFLGGGEPFLHTRIWDILAYCRDAGKKVSIVTNGTLLADLPQRRLGLLGESVGMMSVSIDSADPAEHDRIRGRVGSFDKAVAFIRNPLRTNRVALASVLMPDLRGAEGIIELARSLDCPVNFQPIMFESNYPHMPKAAWKENLPGAMASAPGRRRALRRLSRRARKLGVVTNLGLVRRYFDLYCRLAGTAEYFQDRVVERFFCFVPILQVTVDERGRLAPCSLLAGGASIFAGDLYENWRAMAVRCRRLWRSGWRAPVCRSCACHFAENLRSSILAFPLANRASVPWLLAYYAGRLYHREGRKV